MLIIAVIIYAGHQGFNVGAYSGCHPMGEERIDAKRTDCQGRRGLSVRLFVDVADTVAREVWGRLYD